MKSLTNYLTKNFFISASKTLVVSIATLFLLPIIIKKIGLELYGIVSLTLLFSSVSSLVDLGLSKAVILLSGNGKKSENIVVSSALYINLIVIGILSIGIIFIQLFSIDVLGKDLNINESNKSIVLNIGFLLLVLMLLNNLCRSILEANYKIHLVNLTLAFYTPLLYLSIFTLSLFTKKIAFYVFTPLVLTSFMLIFNIILIKLKTTVCIIKVSITDIQFVLKKSLAFLNIGLINSMVMPIMRYVFVLVVADISLYAIFDLSFKIAMIANSFILSLATPMFAVFTKEIKFHSEKMTQVAYKIFYLSLGIYLAINIGYYFLGNYVLNFLKLTASHSTLLYNITFILIASIGSVAIVEVFYRYFLGNSQLKQAFMLKLIIPVFGIILFFVFQKAEHIYRFIYAYGFSLFISAFITAFSFITMRHKTQKVTEI